MSIPVPLYIDLHAYLLIGSHAIGMIDPKDVTTVLRARPVQIPLAIEGGHLVPAPLLKVVDQRRFIAVSAIVDAAAFFTRPRPLPGHQPEDM